MWQILSHFVFLIPWTTIYFYAQMVVLLAIIQTIVASNRDNVLILKVHCMFQAISLFLCTYQNKSQIRARNIFWIRKMPEKSLCWPSDFYQINLTWPIFMNLVKNHYLVHDQVKSLLKYLLCWINKIKNLILPTPHLSSAIFLIFQMHYINL